MKTGKISTICIAAIMLAAPASSVSTFGDASTDSLPEIRNISVYNVTGVSGEQNSTGGELESYGLNKTFRVNQTEKRREYRFSFRIENTGSSYWNLSGEDKLRHENIGSSWSLDRAWYNISGQEYEGGQFSGGDLTWDTGQGGNLSPGGEMYAKYLFEADITSSELYSQRFLANDSGYSSGSEDSHELDLDRLGYLNVSINDPPNQTVLTENKTFPLNASLVCLEGECGDVKASARYNQSQKADSLIPGSSGEPFHTENTNTKDCGNSLKASDWCSVEWSVNSTGSPGSFHLLDSNFSSSYTEIEQNDTVDHRVEIRQNALLNLSWNQTGFGTLDPGDTEKPAEGNFNLSYNVSVPEESNPVDIWVNGTDLSRQGSLDYEIGVSNLSFSTVNDTSEDKNLSKSYRLFNRSVNPSETLNSFYWLDVPLGILSGDYTGNMSFKANVSG